MKCCIALLFALTYAKPMIGNDDINTNTSSRLETGVSDPSPGTVQQPFTWSFNKFVLPQFIWPTLVPPGSLGSSTPVSEEAADEQEDLNALLNKHILSTNQWLKDLVKPFKLASPLSKPGVMPGQEDPEQESSVAALPNSLTWSLYPVHFSHLPGKGSTLPVTSPTPVSPMTAITKGGQYLVFGGGHSDINLVQSAALYPVHQSPPMARDTSLKGFYLDKNNVVALNFGNDSHHLGKLEQVKPNSDLGNNMSSQTSVVNGDQTLSPFNNSTQNISEPVTNGTTHATNGSPTSRPLILTIPPTVGNSTDFQASTSEMEDRDLIIIFEEEHKVVESEHSVKITFEGNSENDFPEITNVTETVDTGSQHN